MSNKYRTNSPLDVNPKLVGNFFDNFKHEVIFKTSNVAV